MFLTGSYIGHFHRPALVKNSVSDKGQLPSSGKKGHTLLGPLHVGNPYPLSGDIG
jgi:hypothetical protein